MNPADAVSEWQTRGFVVLPAFLSDDDLAPALSELPTMFPTPDGFHDGTDERRTRYLEDEFDGIDGFPFASTEFSMLAVHPKIMDLAETLLGQSDLRLSSAETWAKFTGATSYDQELHRDYLNQTILVPSTEDPYQHLELFVFLTDVPKELGPPHLVSYEHTAQLPMNPNFYPRKNGSGDFVSPDDNTALYDAEQSGSAPAGSVIAFNTRTFHRGTGLWKPRGARYSMQLIFRPAEADWGQRTAWAPRSHEPAWYNFVPRATPRQLALFGFPAPGHPYWTDQTLTGITQRYPGLDTTPWRQHLS
ncbi:hypothetical protein E1263_23860 [Kribbella antibiotica]|uniref:Phytanoyl-CoA dioxygenase n=1 Tax=Kribbella antibiotica TaxID=190195 RepID=A0A4R4ZH75_9ACTN|nr:phytanoyl-CoA dioxygenase family protein [Kribbella antibiotica]TDD57410.1 hypothetical protein E1263_23860 [Kribbella antibiotica]